MPKATSERTCPFCKELIKAEATVCKHCGSKLAPAKPEHGGTCPYCKEQIHPEAIRCKHCRSNLTQQGNGCNCGGVHGVGGGRAYVVPGRTRVRPLNVLEPPGDAGQCFEFCTEICI